MIGTARTYDYLSRTSLEMLMGHRTRHHFRASQSVGGDCTPISSRGPCQMPMPSFSNRTSNRTLYWIWKSQHAWFSGPRLLTAGGGEGDQPKFSMAQGDAHPLTPIFV